MVFHSSANGNPPIRQLLRLALSEAQGVPELHEGGVLLADLRKGLQRNWRVPEAGEKNLLKIDVISVFSYVFFFVIFNYN